jgi:hypothetical protein
MMIIIIAVVVEVEVEKNKIGITHFDKFHFVEQDKSKFKKLLCFIVTMAIYIHMVTLIPNAFGGSWAC